jgi:hypothetical protein
MGPSVESQARCGEDVPVAHSVLLIPVPELQPVVPLAHVTVLGPFAPADGISEGLVSELGELFGDVTPFGFRLAKLAQFPGGTVYLSPDPPTPFRNLTHELWRRFPEYPPYGGEFDDVVPHLSVAQDGKLDAVRLRLGPWLPAWVLAREAALVWFEGDEARTLETFPFGTSAA